MPRTGAASGSQLRFTGRVQVLNFTPELPTGTLRNVTITDPIRSHTVNRLQRTNALLNSAYALALSARPRCRPKYCNRN